MVDALEPISPETTLREIAKAIPSECRENMIIIGSLAVGYHYFRDHASMVVRTKDADCLLSPRVQAIPAGVAVTEKLFEENWRFRKDGKRSEPGDAETPDGDLPAVRLHPPQTSEWFLELLAVPESLEARGMQHTRLETRFGHFDLISLRFLGLINHDPIKTDLGIWIARPEMMALANLLEHPEIRHEVMSGGFAGRSGVKRSNKDLGRVLAIARLAVGRDEDAMEAWPGLWKSALQDRFPEEWRELAARTGQGLRVLLASEPDLEQALHTCINGLLASKPPTLEQMRIAGQRLLQDAIEPLENTAS